MSAATRLGAYGAALAIVFGGTYLTADAVVPEDTVKDWTERAQGHTMDGTTGGHGGEGGHGDDGGHGSAETGAAVPGVTSAQGGYLLTPVSAPGRAGRSGELSFRVLDAEGEPLTRYTTSHEKPLHLIVVRTDGTRFRHVHPTMDADGTWSLPWEWSEAGTYRIYADFVPGPEEGAATVTLTRTVEVAGDVTPVTPEPTTTATVDGYTVELTGQVSAGSGSELTFTVSKDGQPVTDLQPYLGAFGHLVALRDGDLAFLHVHPDGEEPAAGDTAGPDVGFVAELPTPGRYLLYLDFQVDGQVRTAPFVVDTTGAHTDAATDAATDAPADTETGAGPGAGSGDGHDH